MGVSFNVIHPTLTGREKSARGVTAARRRGDTPPRTLGESASITTLPTYLYPLELRWAHMEGVCEIGRFMSCFRDLLGARLPRFCRVS